MKKKPLVGSATRSRRKPDAPLPPAADEDVVAQAAATKMRKPMARAQPAVAARVRRSATLSAASKATGRGAPATSDRPGSAIAKTLPSAALGVDTGTAPPASAKSAAAAAPGIKERKAKLVKDSFAMPESEYAVLGEVKKTCLAAGVSVKKSELLRIGVALVGGLGIRALKLHIAGLSPLKSGRPRKE